MKKSIVAMSIALLVASQGASLALAAPVAPSTPSASSTRQTGGPTGENPTPPAWADVGVSRATNAPANSSTLRDRLAWPTGENPHEPTWASIGSSSPAVHVEIQGPTGEATSEPHMNITM